MSNLIPAIDSITKEILVINRRLVNEMCHPSSDADYSDQFIIDSKKHIESLRRIRTELEDIAAGNRV